MRLPFLGRFAPFAIPFCPVCGLSVQFLGPGQPLIGHTYPLNRISTGCIYIDYVHSYDHIITYKPNNFLHRGPAATTLLIPHVIKQNCNSESMTLQESISKCHDLANRVPPSHLTTNVNLELTSAIANYCHGIKRTIYPDVPDRRSDFVFPDVLTTKRNANSIFTHGFISIVNNPLLRQRPYVGHDWAGVRLS